MRSSFLIVCLLTSAFVAAPAPVAAGADVAAPQAPLVPGLAGKHPLSEELTGRLLIAELQCVACHKGDAGLALSKKTSPLLDEIGSRVSPDYLRQYLVDPGADHRGTTMPNLLDGYTNGQRSEIADALTHYLVAQTDKPFKQSPIDQSVVASGKELFHSVGCVACHSPRDAKGTATLPANSVALEHTANKYSVDSLTGFLYQPLAVRPDGRMPDMKLTPTEAKAVASYLMTVTKSSATPSVAAMKPDPEKVKLGETYFNDLNCAACHQQGEDVQPPKEKPLTEIDPSRGCLSPTPGKAPNFRLSPDQRKAIVAALKTLNKPIDDDGQIKLTLTALNCIACHERDDYGGVDEARNDYFQSSEPDLGDHARIPPHMTVVGAKLNTLWLQKVLFSGESIRDYMHTRMPQYGKENLDHFVDLVERHDKLDHKASFPEPNKQEQKLFRSAGRQLLGNDGLNCVTCHAFNGKQSQNFKGLDILTSYERLQPAWFDAYVRSPQVMRPGSIMPEYWPDGEAAFQDILDGDTEKQIRAIWYYFSLGQSAADPPGIQSEPTNLVVTDTTRTYRGRSSVAGYRGIAVGFPDGLNYAFNAKNGTLSCLWTGDYVRVGWSGQGPGNFNPSGRAIQLAQDVSFYKLPNEQSPWPLRPRTTKEQPVDPDPLYPKNRGYQFRGYQLDADMVPTFKYRTGDIKIEDRSAADLSGENPVLKRAISFEAPRNQIIWFRALTGKVEQTGKGQYKAGQISLTIPVSARPLLRPFDGGEGPSELLLELKIPKGLSQVEFEYEISK